MAEPARHDDATGMRPRLTPEAGGPGWLATITPWFAFLGGAAAWIVHLSAGYALTEIACQSERLAVAVLGIPALHFFAFALTLIAALMGVAAAIVAFGMYPNGARADPVDDTGALESLGRMRFMSFAGVIMNGVFVIAILAGGLPFMFLRTCGGT
jgi:hypothetical protein